MRVSRVAVMREGIGHYVVFARKIFVSFSSFDFLGNMVAISIVESPIHKAFLLLCFETWLNFSWDHLDTYRHVLYVAKNCVIESKKHRMDCILLVLMFYTEKRKRKGCLFLCTVTPSPSISSFLLAVIYFKLTPSSIFLQHTTASSPPRP